MDVSSAEAAARGAGKSAVVNGVSNPVRQLSALDTVDRALQDFAVTHRPPPVVTLAQGVTALGSLPGVVVLTAVLIAVVLTTSTGPPWRTRMFAPLLALTVAVGYVGSILLKSAVGRARPPVAQQLGPAAIDPSFPSGHALSTTVLVGLALMVVRSSVAPGPWRKVIYAVLAVLWAGVGASRVVLGYHWPSDVVGGWLCGAVVICAFVVSSRRLTRPGASNGRKGLRGRT